MDGRMFEAAHTAVARPANDRASVIAERPPRNTKTSANAEYAKKTAV